MVKRALNAGIMADYLLADAWFGIKAMLGLTQETSLVPVLRMKKNKMILYRVYPFNGNPVLFIGDRQTDTRLWLYCAGVTNTMQQQHGY